MRRFLTHYAAFFRHPDVPRLLAMVLVMRMPVGMMSLAMLMHLRELSGSFAFAGGMVGTYLVAMAASAPVQGRVIDRYGPRGADRKSTRLNSSHSQISYAGFCLQ